MKLPETEGWHTDPTNKALERYFDGVKWTLQVRFPGEYDKREPVAPPDFSKARRAEEIWAAPKPPTNPRLAADLEARAQYQKSAKKKKLGLFSKKKRPR